MADGTVICSIERLFDWEPANEAVVGVTLSAAWGNTTAAPPTGSNFLFPWKWLPWSQGPETLGFYWACLFPGDATVKPKFSPSAIFSQPLMRNGKRVSSIRNNGNYKEFTERSIQPRYDKLSKNLANLGYPKGGQNNVTVAATSSEGRGDVAQYASGARWPSILADLSTRPAPIPHALVLSFIFQLGKIADLLPTLNDGSLPKPDDCRLLIAPVLTAMATAKGSDTIPVTDPSVTPLTAGGDDSSKIWSYTDNNYQASSQMVALGGQPKQTSFFDMASRLVKAVGSEKWHFNEDWQSSFESRIAERLDLSAELVRILEKESFDDATARNVIDAAIAAFRDVIGIGIDGAPSNVSFLQPGNVNPSTAFLSIKPALASSVFKDLTGWKTFLSKTVFGSTETVLSDTYLANLDLWSQNPIKASDAVLQLNRVRQKLLAPEALWALLQLQVSVLSPGTTVKPPDNLGSLPATLRSENLGRYWRKGLLGALATPASGYSAEAIRKALAKQLQTMAIARFSDSDFFPAVSGAVASAVSTALNKQSSADDWRAAATYAMPEAASAPLTDPGQGTASLAPQGITVQINELGDTANKTNVAGSEAADVRKLQGAGLVLGYDTIDTKGKVSTRGYTCLNYADVCYQSTVGGTPTCKVLEHAALIPLRFSWHNDVALATVSYNNEPLPAAGPLSRAAKLVSPGGGDSVVNVAADPLWYSYPTAETIDPQHPDPKTALTALTFGRDYHPQPFLVSNSGALPRSLSTDYLDLKTGSSLDTAPGIGATWTSINYRRQAKPGALRLSNANTASVKHLALPAIPDAVFPRVKIEDDQPVVLLVPDQGRFTKDLPTSFAFNVRPPATDLLTWDRFVNGFGNDLANHRTEVLNGFLAEIARHSEPKGDITIDDPATVYTGYDCKVYYELFDEGNTTPRAAAFVSFPKPVGPGISAVQAGALQFSLLAARDDSASKNEPTSLTVNAPNISVTVYEGRYAILRLYACVHKSYLKQFEASLFSGPLKEDYYLLKPTNIAIEVATDALPSETDLFDPNKFQVGAFNPSDGTATVSLNLGGVPNGQYVYSAETLRQVWQWQGRPVMPLPASGEVSSEWLLREFGTRADTDLLRAPMLPPPAGQSSYVFTEQRGALLSDADRARGNLQKIASSVSVSAESRLLGTYIRYGVQVESRYKPLLLQNGYRRGKGTDGKVWRNLYVASRKLTQIKPPNVKLVLPLTRNPADPASGPGLLVMLRGPWFQECGLGERLEAQIVLRERPEDAPDATPKTFYYQYGPDPILYHPKQTRKLDPIDDRHLPESGWGDSTADTKNKTRNQRETIRGPVGHTFDTVSTGQLFVNTSFVLNYPVVENLDWTPWLFCQLQVRRVVDVIGGGSPASASDWSPPTWIQLLPDFDRYAKDAQFADLDLSYQTNSGHFQLVTHSTGQAVSLTPGDGSAIYANYLAVSHFVSDVTGIPVQEAYDGLYRQSDTDWIPIGSSSALSKEIQPFCRARVLTVQGKRPSVTQEDTFWNNMFTIDRDPGSADGALIDDMDRLRIVSVSRPIDVPNALYKGC